MLDKAKESSNLLIKESMEKSINDAKQLFVTASDTASKQKTTDLNVSYITGKVNKTNKEIEEMIRRSVNGADLKEHNESGQHWMFDPETAIDDPRWSKTIGVAIKHNRLTPSTIASIEAVGNGLMQDSKNISQVIKLFKNLKYYTEYQSDGSYITVDLTNKLVGNTIDKQALAKLDSAVNVSYMEGSSTTSVLKQITRFNDTKTTSINEDAFWSMKELQAYTPENTNASGMTRNNSAGGYKGIIRKLTNNARDIDTLATWLEYKVKYGNKEFKSLDEVNKVVTEELDKLTDFTTNVFDPEAKWETESEAFGVTTSSIKSSRMKSRYALTKLIPPNKMESFYNHLESIVPAGMSIARNVNKSSVVANRLNQSTEVKMPEGTLYSDSNLFDSRLKSGQSKVDYIDRNNKLIYLVPASEDPDNMKFNLVEIVSNGTTTDYIGVRDPVTDQFMSVTIDQ